MANRVREYRQLRGWSARELAERCQQTGLEKWNREIVANLERGKRGIVSIDEVLVLAVVLGVPPVMLFVPLGDAPELQVTPQLSVDAWSALQWICGNRPSPVETTPGTEVDPDMQDQRMWSSARVPLDLYAKHSAAMTSLLMSLQMLAWADHDSDEGAHRQALAARGDALKQVAAALNSMVAQGVVTPAVPPDVFDTLTSLNLLDRPEAVRTERSDG